MTEQEMLEEFGNLPGNCPCCQGTDEHEDVKLDNEVDASE